MHSLHHLAGHVHKHGFQPKLLYATSLMIFFWSIFDGILSYILPVMIVEQGVNKTEMGLIIGSSSIVGAIFDVILSKFLKAGHYRRLYLSMFILSFIFVMLLWGASVLWLYVLAMAIWGMYWDLFNFGTTDFVSKTALKEDFSGSFGVIGVFKALGCLIAPIIAGLVVGQVIDGTPFIVSLVMLGIAALFYVVLMVSSPTSKSTVPQKLRHESWLSEIQVWRGFGRQLLPVLILTLLFFITEAFFWTIGPLIAEETPALGQLRGLFIVAYLLPPMLLGWFVGHLTHRFGKKHTALYCFFIGSVLISLLGVVQNPILMLAVIFLASCFISMTLPAINGAYADYISETKGHEKEIQGISDFFYNAGWVLGPILAGFIADHVGDTQSFAVLGIFCAGATLVLIKIMPKAIKLKVAEVY